MCPKTPEERIKWQSTLSLYCQNFNICYHVYKCQLYLYVISLVNCYKSSPGTKLWKVIKKILDILNIKKQFIVIDTCKCGLDRGPR